MEELELRLLEKQLTTKLFFILEQKGHFFKNNGGTMKNVIALNLYIGTNVLVYEGRLMLKVWLMTKFVLKKHFLQKYLYFL